MHCLYRRKALFCNYSFQLRETPAVQGLSLRRAVQSWLLWGLAQVFHLFMTNALINLKPTSYDSLLYPMRKHLLQSGALEKLKIQSSKQCAFIKFALVLIGVNDGCTIYIF